MDDTTLNDMRKRLNDALAALADAQVLGHDAQAVVTLDQQATGRLSRQDALIHQAMAKATHARRALEATRIRAALARMEDGDYGYCTDCGDAIALSRLEHDPAAAKCISCARG